MFAQTKAMSGWSRLHIPGKELVEARLQCHHAVQINTRLARGFVPAKADDSHTTLCWDWASGALTGQPAGQLRLGLRIADLTLVLSGASVEVLGAFPLDRRTLQEAFDWLGSRLKGFGFDPAPLAKPIHFELDDHPLLHGCQFEFSGRERLFEELARWYGNAALCVSGISSPVQSWPHHFDIATQIALGERSIGVGLSPGDANYAQPYFYVTPWPYLEPDRLPRLASGTWHTEGWVGAVLTADEIVLENDQEGFVNGFLSSVLRAAR